MLFKIKKIPFTGVFHKKSFYVKGKKDIIYKLYIKNDQNYTRTRENSEDLSVFDYPEYYIKERIKACDWILVH
jgi:hypothetical protein